MYILVTNNGMCHDKYVGYHPGLTVDYLESGAYLDVLKRVRDYIHRGYRLETHPLAGSLKPNQIPYKSVILSDQKADREEFYEYESLIEHSINTSGSFLSGKTTPEWPEQIKRDFQFADMTLIDGAADRMLDKHF